MDIKVIDDTVQRLTDLDKLHTQSCPYPEGCDCYAIEHNKINYDLRLRLRALRMAVGGK